MTTQFKIEPPLLNSSSPWATTLDDLKALYACPYTGAITTRTSLINGFKDNPNQHQHCFFDAGSAAESGSAQHVGNDASVPNQRNSSMNTYGYSPIPLTEYISFIKQLAQQHKSPTESLLPDIHAQAALTMTPSESKDHHRPLNKRIIISITGTPGEITKSYDLVHELAQSHPALNLAIEINLSCPNIADKPPPAYNHDSLTEYLEAIREAKQAHESSGPLPIGLKLPPYTYIDQMRTVVQALQEQVIDRRSAIDFISSTNTLGSCLLLDSQHHPALMSESGTGLGGMAGASIHALSLGNVSTLRRLFDEHEATRGIVIIGVGGVSDRAGFDRMMSVGAGAVGVATALGRHGVDVFERIAG